MKDYYAHSGNDVNRWHLLREHLASVANLAKSYVADWKGAEEAELAGLLHDLGKYGERFQNRLHGQDQGLDHWSQGAYLAIRKGGALAAALAIQGHHVGLQSMQKDDLKKLHPDVLSRQHPQNLSLSESDVDLLENCLEADGLRCIKPKQRLFSGFLGVSEARVDNMLDIRRLFSALVDADFIDTEAHFNGDEDGKSPRMSGLKLNQQGLAQRASEKLSAFINSKSSLPNQTENLHKIRQQLLHACLQGADQKTGVFTLTAPTGSGKTLSMLSFALRHAEQNKLERIILVVPYLSIIEQTAAIYREIFADLGEDFVLEHHSMAGLGAETAKSDAEGNEESQQQNRRQRLLSENWDAPVVITTSVQFLESLFSNRPSGCRKIHRIANSVVLFDEVQTLPTALAIPSLAALSHIARHWHSTMVFATATQPAFDHLHEQVQIQASAGWQPKPIVADHAAMANALRRVHYTWMNEKLTWQALAGVLQTHSQVLCIVNLKRHAHDLWQALETTSDLFHLSTNLCPLHRQSMLEEVRQRLKNGLPCRLIATQCIEAGVDVDFPVVYRAFAPLDAIIQAAGRCNREGRLEVGQAVIFIPACDGRLYPDATYEQAAGVALSLKNELDDAFDLYNPDVIQRYYKRLYTVADPGQLAKPLYEAIKNLNFPEVAHHYRLIKHDAINVVVPYDLERFEQLKLQAEQQGLTVKWIKRARSSSISLYRPRPDDPVWDSLLPVQAFRQGKHYRQDDWFIAANLHDYDEKLGYRKPDSLNCWIA
ncbi:CRISPR-associated helicase Cas3' [Methylomicrobium sp. Wu6]|uniref:CRISPR-associated helicase Cas3' n=1 Tax=Methylomicrobium sp. Wu6 TaxID=3107928 RepID=UPI002DD64697|nr:CRISPR-associated helicase Cas3' [Methylomicrobium sp. Wu6]MEC4747653.1 CRISPR-associated helicase Cas3' [Methylomicrobium sp. Wu6]